MPSIVTATDVLRYCAQQRWVVVGHDLKLVVRPGETVMVAVLARDRRGHFLAISPVGLADEGGFGIIDLNTAEARIARPRGLDTQRAN